MSVVELAVAEDKPAGGLSTARLDYRSDIDGLRAIAVLAVVLAHAGIPGFSGGFVGVDIFFVISGFLITRNLDHAAPEGLRGLWRFYGRRVRRTLPALYLVLAVTLAASIVLLLPGEIDALCQSMVAVLLFVPNIYFLSKTGYFAQVAMSKPLLHTWSLGVEEQYYLVAPLLPYALRQFAQRSRRMVLCALVGVALVFGIGLRAVSPDAAFYLMPARLWEFLAGCLVAERVIPPIRVAWLAEVIAAAALVSLATAIALYTSATPYPGFPTLVPCVATAALIHVGGGVRRPLVSQMVGNRLLAGIGLISYSVYLWHWPAIVLAYLSNVELSPASQVSSMFALLGVSALSWRFVELPFRTPGSILRQYAARILLIAPALISAACIAIVGSHGLPSRFAPDVVKLDSYYDYMDQRQYREGECFLSTSYASIRYFNEKACLQKSATQPNYLIVGDSHAAHLWVGLKAIFPSANFMQVTASGCKPLPRPAGKTYCTDLMRALVDTYLPRLRPIDVIVIAADWHDGDADGALEEMQRFQAYAKKVVVIGRIPSHVSALPELLARGLLQHSDALLRRQQSVHPFRIDAEFKRVFPQTNYVSLVGGLCPERRCMVYAAPGVPLQFDSDHLTTEGSIVVARYIKETHILDRP